MCTLRVLLLTVALAAIPSNTETISVRRPTEWWQTATLYQIWPRSFKDSDGDGVGDLNGITSKLDYLAELGIEVVWLSPFFASPLIDSGYDVSDYLSVNPAYGTLDDFDALVARAKKLGLKVVLDYVPNHTSDEHAWFNLSRHSVDPYTDYYVWNDGISVNGTRQPPNNWLSVFNSGSAWQWDETRQQYYLHQFHVKQPDLNFRNEKVINETKNILTFWLDRGIDGFRIDSLPYMVENIDLLDEPESGLEGYTETDFYYLDHIYVKDQPENYEIVRTWRNHVDDYSKSSNVTSTRVTFTEAYANLTNIMKYYEYGSHVPFNFFFIKDSEGVNNAILDTADDVVQIITQWMTNMPEGGTANWVFGNHDNSRIATKLGEGRVDAVNILLFLLPGVATIYNGDELGMTDTYLTWQQTEDPQACNTDPSRYEYFSRDPERTPYQWDNTTSAGFSTNNVTMLPVNSNYLEVNLAAQQSSDVSHYKNVEALIKLRRTNVIREGSLDVKVLNDSIISFSRELKNEEPIIVLINWDNETSSTVNLEVFENVPDNLEVLIADIHSGIDVGTKYVKNEISLPPNAAIVLRRDQTSGSGAIGSSDHHLLPLLSILFITLIVNRFFNCH
ncbi:alpha-glucosidase-like [Athalia rosae]|uniref:alpha-glucosidase-like n=1 Tax=Athalia rosae TaxID=37344 RepID=UPI0020333FB8|nr:alpha-glucosidase-like [Athalia rosae]